jgi:T1SS-143 domain-containing protein
MDEQAANLADVVGRDDSGVEDSQGEAPAANQRVAPAAEHAAAADADTVTVAQAVATTQHVATPPAGEQVTIQVQPGVQYDFDFHKGEADFVFSDGNLVILIHGGGEIILEGFGSDAAGSLVPPLHFAGDIIGAFDLLSQTASAEQLADIQPAAGGGGGAGLTGGASFNPFEPGPLPPSIPAIGPVPPTALAFAPPELTPFVFPTTEGDPTIGSISTALVDEDDLTKCRIETGPVESIVNLAPTPNFEGNHDTVSPDDNLPNPSPLSVTQSLSIDFGPNGPGDIVFSETGQPDLTSEGNALSYRWDEGTHTLTAYWMEGGAEPDAVQEGIEHDVFTVVVDVPSGTATFTLLDHLDHAPGGNENNLAFGLTFTATDGVGNPATGSLPVEIDDDMPLLHPTYGHSVSETLLDHGTADDHLSSTPSTSGYFWASFGADGPAYGGGYSLVDSLSVTDPEAADSANNPVTLTSGNVAVDTTIIGGVVVGYLHGTDPNDSDNQVFTLKITDQNSGQYEFTLLKQLDHPDHDQTGTQDPLVLNFTYKLTDYDGDSATSTLSINVRDDGPIADGQASPVGGMVEEDGMSFATGDLSDGNKQGGDANADDEISGAAGSLTSLFNGGADQPITISLIADTSSLPALLSKGEVVTYAVTTTADVDGDGVADSLLTATAGGRTVFTLQVNSGGSWSFDLHDQLDHVAGNGENTALQVSGGNPVPSIDFSSILKATDFDGDSATGTAAGKFTITVEDDIPVANGQASPVSGSVQEDGMSTVSGSDTLHGSDLSEGNKELGGTNADDETSGSAGTLTSLFSAGADEPIKISLATDTNGLPALLSKGQVVTYAVTTTADVDGDGVADSLLTATAGGRTVFTLQVNSGGSWSFDLHDQLDHVAGNGENFALQLNGGGSVNSIDFSSVLKATDFDGDTVAGAGNGQFTISVQDDIPVANTNASPVSGSVQEDGMSTVPGSDTLHGSDLSEGNKEALGTNADDETSAGAGSLTSLFSAGADEPIKISLATDTSGLPALLSKGEVVTYAVTTTADVDGDGVSESLLTATAGGRTVFTLQVNSGGSWSFDLHDQLDHVAGNGENFALQLNGGGSVGSIDFSSVLKATDFDGDTVAGAGAGKFTITVQDDVPVANGQASPVSGSVQEDGMSTVPGSDTLHGSDLSEGNKEALGTNADDETSAGAGSLSTLFSSGADEPVKISLITDTTSLPALLSKGELVTYAVTTTADVDGDGVADSLLTATAGGRTVFMLQVNSNGSWSFDLHDQLDHVLGNDENTALQVNGGGSVNSIDFSAILKGTDFDGDTVAGAGAGKFTITVQDDVPVANDQASPVSGSVQEDGMSTVPGSDTLHGSDLSEGNKELGGTNADDETSGSAGSLTALFSAGADEPVKLSLITDTSGLPALLSKGEVVTYAVTTTADLDGDGVADSLLTATAGGRTVFTLQVNSGGSWSFDLHDQLDHVSGNSENFALQLNGGGSVNSIDFSAILKATDFDGDTVAGAGSGKFTISVQDDIPVQNTATASGVVEEEQLPGGNEDTTGGGGLDHDTLGNFNITTAVATGSLAGLVNVGADEPASFSFNGSANSLSQLALQSHGQNVVYSVNGDTLTGYVDSGSVGGALDDGDRKVFTLALSGTHHENYTFTLLDQLDHTPGDGENTALIAGDSTVTGIDFSSVIDATDADGDKITLDFGSVSITVIDDVPVANAGATPVSGSVEEDGMSTVPGSDTVHGVDSSEGNKELGDTNSDDETSGGAGSLTALFSSGADEPLTIGLSAVTSGLPALLSQGHLVSYAVVGNVLTGFVDSGAAGLDGGDRLVFTLTVHGDGSWEFDLKDQLDHVLGNGENTALQLNGGGSVNSIDFSSILKATDFDGDTVTSAAPGKFTITVQDDIPVANASASSVSGSVQEDGMSTVAGSDTVHGSDLSEGNKEALGTNADDETSGGAGSLSALFSSGADEPVKISLITDTSSLPALLSKGQVVTYAVTTTADVDGDGVADSLLIATAGGRTVFTLQVNSNGSWSFDLHDQLDHVLGNGENTALQLNGGGSTGSIDFSSILKATDFDGDTVAGAGSGKFTISVQDDVPVANASAPSISGSVQEDGMSTVAGSDTLHGSDLSEGNKEALGTNADDETSGSAGALTALFSSGADEPVKISLITDTTSLPALLSKGQVVTYAVTTTADIDGDGVADSLLTATAGGRTVFTLQVNSGGSWSFDLHDQLDHVSGNSENFALQLNGGGSTGSIDFSSILKATDFDGDTVAGAGSGKFTISVQDDIPVASGSTIGGVVEEEQLSGGNEDTTGGGGLDHDTLIDFTITTNVASRTLTGLVNVGADEPASFGLDTVTSGLPALKSHGENVVYSVSGDTLTGYVDSGSSPGSLDGTDRKVFTLVLSGTNHETFTFTLQDQLDHQGANGENTTLIDGASTVSGIDFSSVIKATDADGDVLSFNAGTVSVTVIDDVPLAANDTASVNEGDSIIGDLDANDSLGADGPGSPLVLSVAGQTDASDGTTDHLIHVIGAHGTLVVNDTTGGYTYTAGSVTSDQQDTFNYVIQDFDHDTVDAVLTVTVKNSNDTPTAGGASIAVDEDDLLKPPASFTGNSDVIGPDDDLPDSSPTTLSGSLGVDFGNDTPGSIAFNTGDQPTGLTSGGQAIVYDWNSGTHTLTGYVDTGAAGLDGADRKVFTVQIDDVSTSHYVFTLLDHLDHPTLNDTIGDNTENNITLGLKYTVSDSNGDTVAGFLNVDVDDDRPHAHTESVSETAQNNGQTNVLIILDTSLSMSVSPSGVTNMTRLDVAKAAIAELLDQYDNRGDVRVLLETFNSTGNLVTGWVTVDQAKAAVAGLTATVAATNYDAAITTAEGVSFTTGGALTGAGVQNVSYFISDGEPNQPSGSEGIDGNEESTWISNLVSKQVTSFSIAISSDVNSTDNIDPIAYDGVNNVNTGGTLVQDLSQLSTVLTNTVSAPPITGNLVTATGPTPGVTYTGTAGGLGADGGYVKAIAVDGTTYTYNPTNAYNAAGGGTVSVSGTDHSLSLVGSVLTVDLGVNGKIAIDMATGGYTYTPPGTLAGSVNESVGFTFTDYDGDTAGDTLHISITGAENPPLARDDRVITNVTGGSAAIAIPSWALLGNDTAPADQTLSITATSNASDGSVSPPSGSPITTVTFTDNGDTDGGAFRYTATDTPAGQTDTADVTVNRAQQGEDTLDGTGLNDILIGRDSTVNGDQDRILGNEGDDILIGAAGNDTLDGGAGNDTMDGGAGNDSLIGNGGTDWARYADATNPITANLSGVTDTVTGTDVGTDTLSGVENIIGGAGNDTMTGDSSANYFIGNGGDDSLVGNDGDDTLRGGAGNDVIAGGNGNDLIDFSDGTAGITFTLDQSAGTHTTGALAGGLGNDSYSSIEGAIGTNFADTLVGDNTAADILRGGGGNDSIDGRGGNDTLDGGLGNDTLVGNGGTDWVSYAAIAAGVLVDLSLGTAVGQGVDSLSGVENVLGSTQNDTIGGDANNNVLDGNDGNDFLAGAGGADTLTGGNGDDTLDGGAGSDSLVGGAGNDWVTYASVGGAMVVNLGTGVATGDGTDSLATIENVIGGSGGDSITGDGNANILIGNAGNDTIIGGAGNDTIEGGPGADSLDGGTNTDTLTYAHSLAGVNVNLQTGAASGGDAAGDTIANFENLIGSNASDVLSGSTGANLILGGGGDDSIDGNTGNDTLDGGAGNDWVVFTSNATAVNVDLGAGTATGQGTDTITGFENVLGNSGDDTITGDGLANIIVGGAGNDSIEGGAGADNLDGGANTDTLSYANSASAVNVNLQTGAASGGDAAGDTIANFENLIGSGNNDTLTGSAGDNSISGGAGSDIIVGGAGNDTLEGGSGADNLDGGADTDTLSYAASAAAVNVNLGTNAVSGGDAAGDTIANFENVLGSAGNDTITGNGSANLLDGNSGNDSISGGAGADTLLGGAGNDTLEGGTGADSLDGGANTDTLSYATSVSAVNVNLGTGAVSGGDAAGDTIANFENLIGSGGDDTLTGSSGANTITGGAGNDTIEGGAGADNLDGGANTDTLSYAASGAAVNVNLGTNAVSGGDAAGDTIANFENVLGSAGNDTITGNGSANLLDGNSGNDSMSGGAGADTLLGGAGNDTLEGGSGADSLDGGANTDTLSYATSVSAVNVNLGTGAVSGGDAAGDTIANFENLIGSGGDDTLTGSSGANTITGGAGNDTIEGGAGADNLDGGANTDTLSYAASSLAVNVNLGTGAVSGGDAAGDTIANFENLIGSSFGDSLTGSSGSNTLDGGLGNDTLTGGAGTDSLIVGGGNDIVVVNAVVGTSSDSARVTVGGNANDTGQDTVTGFDLANDTLRIVGTNVSNFVHGTDTAIGTATAVNDGTVGSFTALTGLVELNQTTNNDWDDAGDIAVTFASPIGTFNEANFESRLQYDLTGTSGSDTITTGALDDTIAGGAGTDAINSGAGHDVIEVNAVVGTSSDSGRVAPAGNGNDTGQDTITGFDLANDTLKIVATGVSNFSHGIDTAIGTAGAVNDGTVGSFTNTTGLVNLSHEATLTIGNGDVAVTFSSPTGTFNEANFESRLQYDLTGTSGNDTITAGALDDTVTSAVGNDVLNGGGGNDVLNGGTGNDSLTGAAGNDTFSFDLHNHNNNTGLANTDGADHITDFDKANDVLSFTNVFDNDANGTITLSDLDASITSVVDSNGIAVGGNVTVTFGNGASVVFDNAGTTTPITQIEDLVTNAATQIQVS